MDYFIDPIIKDQLDQVKDRVLNKDTDFVAITDGETGSGKSVLTMQLAKYLDPNFTSKNVCFTAEEFISIIRDPLTPKGSCIIMDEAYSSSSARQALSQVNHAINSLAMEMRQRNLFVFFILPSFFDLDRPIALHRSRALFHVYFATNGERRYIVFDRKAKQTLYLTGKKKYSYKWPKATFPPARFSNYYTINEQEYREKKAKAFEERPKTSRRDQILENQRSNLLEMYIKATNKSYREVDKELEARGIKGLSIPQISREYNKVINKKADFP